MRKHHNIPGKARERSAYRLHVQLLSKSGDLVKRVTTWMYGRRGGGLSGVSGCHKKYLPCSWPFSSSLRLPAHPLSQPLARAAVFPNTGWGSCIRISAPLVALAAGHGGLRDMGVKSGFLGRISLLTLPSVATGEAHRVHLGFNLPHLPQHLYLCASPHNLGHC